MEIEDRLKSLGYAVAGTVPSGAEAVDRAAELRPDLVLMDIKLSGEMDGVEAADIGDRFDIPVIYLTAYADDDTVQRAKLAEPFGHLIEPFEEGELHSAIQMALYKHRMERRLRESEQRLSTTLRSIGDGVIATDNDARIRFMNPVAESLTGWEAAQVLGDELAPVFSIVDRETGSPAENPVTRALQEGTVVGPGDHPILVARDGTERPIYGSAAPIRDEKGNVTGAVLVFRDITERMETEAQRDAALEELRKAHQRLERQVAERTTELRETNELLRREIAERIQTQEALQRTNRELRLLDRASRAFNSTLDLDRVLVAVLEEVRGLMDVTGCSTWLIDPATGRLVCRQATGAQSELVRGWPVAPGEGIGGWVVRRGESLIVPDVLADERHYTDVAERTGLELRSVLSVPMGGRQGIIGVLQVVDTEVDRFDSRDQLLLEPLAASAATAIENARLYEQVRAGHERLQALSHRLVEVQEAERRHIARELHDEVGQVLTGLKLLLESSTALPPDARSSSLSRSLALVDELVTQVQELSLDLRPAMLDDLGLLPTLVWHINRYGEQTGIDVDFKYLGPERRLDSEVETAAYRIVQEALTNVARHAGVSEVTVRLSLDQEMLRVQIEDQGAGFDPEAALAAGAASGLSGMEERAILLGGELTIESAPGAGTSLMAELPLGGPLAEEEDSR